MRTETQEQSEARLRAASRAAAKLYEGRVDFHDAARQATRVLDGEIAPLARGNSKLEKGIFNWSIPRVATCKPTPWCLRHCYAKRAERYPSAVLGYWARLLACTDTDLLRLRISQQLARSRGVRAVRIHVTGDFFSDAYVDMWVQIAEAFPAIRFYCYTRRFRDFPGLARFAALPNVRVNISLDPTTPDDARRELVAIAKTGLVRLVYCGGNRPMGVLQCPGSCSMDGCHACIDSRRDAWIEQH